ncbi:MAG: hypothetical protein FD180_3748 [Planctomycetota bacterium]|nr:MAG: hypothetical protein FD180_3748 [Planctomycetota bacterium]
MARGLLIGFLAGALLAGIAFRFLMSRGGGDAEGAAAGDKAGEKSGKTPGGTGGAAASQELATARSESEQLRAEIADLKVQLAEAKKVAGGASKSRLNRAAKWKELASLIAQAKKDAEASGTPIKGDKYFGPLLALIGLVADDLGIPIQEAAMSPDWYPMFAMSMLEASPFPMTEEQRAAFDRIMAESGKDWDAYMSGREGQSTLERAMALRELQFDMFWKMGLMGTQEQKDYIASLNLPPPNAPYQGVWNGAGPRAACKSNISNNMAKSLGLDGNQMTSLSPAIDDYMRSYEAIAKEAGLKKQAGEPYDDLAAKLALSMDMQKRIGETVRLTDAQAKALKEWAQVYDYQVKE